MEKGNSYKRKGDNLSDIFIVDTVDGEFVIFENGARCKISTLQTDFDLIVNQIDNDTEIDFEKFFNTPLGDESLLESVKKVAQNPNTQIVPTRQVEQQNTLFPTIESPNEQLTETNQQIKEVKLPEWAVFERAKRSEEIEILIPFVIKLPRAEKIDALNDLFETSFIDFLAKDFIKENVIKNSNKIEKTLASKIEEWMEEQLYGSSTKKKTTKTKPVKKPKVVEEVEIKEEVLHTPQEEVSVSDFFSQNKKWDGNLVKLIEITTKEQLDKVQSTMDLLKSTNPTSPDIYRYEDMIEIYKQRMTE